MTSTLRATGIAAALVLAAGSAQAGDCSPGKSGFDLTLDEASEVYECLADSLNEGYQKGSKRWIPADYVENYRDWTKVSSAPAAPGFHSGRFLVTWVNEAGAEEYTKFLEERGPMPEGTLIAKESFSVNEDGKVKKGPLFLMEKVSTDKAPKTEGWYYMMVAPNGQPQAVNVWTACSECHQGNFGHRDGMGYPIEAARVGG